jgi:enoyl-[acyl-carrier protein] reductase II
MLHTRFTRDYGVAFPFVSAGMSLLALPELVGAVSEAGGLGLLGASPAPPPAVADMIRAVRRLTARPFGVDLIVDTSPMFGPFTLDAHIDVCVAERAPLVVFHWHMPPQAWMERLHAAGARGWIQVGSVEEARQAADIGADAVIAQGNEAGGHCRSSAGLMALLPAVIDAVAPTTVLAAGGIADGRGAAAALALGAEAVVVGTRLIASQEAYAHAEYKRRVVTAGLADVTRTSIFGVEWPDQEMKVLANRVVREWAGKSQRTPAQSDPPRLIGRMPFAGMDYPIPQFSSMLPTPDTEADLEEMCLAAGDSVALVHDVQPAATIVRVMMAEAEAILRQRVSSLLRD